MHPQAPAGLATRWFSKACFKQRAERDRLGRLQRKRVREVKKCVLKTCISEGLQLRISLYSGSRNAWTCRKPIFLINLLYNSALSVQSTCSTSKSVDSHVFTCVLCGRINFSCRPFARECEIVFPCLGVLAHSLCNQWQTKTTAELKGRMQFVLGLLWRVCLASNP